MISNSALCVKGKVTSKVVMGMTQVQLYDLEIKLFIIRGGGGNDGGGDTTSLPLVYRMMLPGVFFNCVVGTGRSTFDGNSLLEYAKARMPQNNGRCRQLYVEYVLIMMGLEKVHEFCEIEDSAIRSMPSADILLSSSIKERLLVDWKLFRTAAMHTATGCYDKKTALNIRRMNRWYNEVVLNSTAPAGTSIFYINDSGPVSLTIMLMMIRLHEQNCLLKTPIWDMNKGVCSLLQTLIGNERLLGKQCIIHPYYSSAELRVRNPNRRAIYIDAAYTASTDGPQVLNGDEVEYYCVLELRFDKKPRELEDHYAAVLNELWELTGVCYMDRLYLNHHLLGSDICDRDEIDTRDIGESSMIHPAAITTYDKIKSELTTHVFVPGDYVEKKDVFTPLPDEYTQPEDAYQSSRLTSYASTTTNLLKIISDEFARNDDCLNVID